MKNRPGPEAFEDYVAWLRVELDDAGRRFDRRLALYVLLAIVAVALAAAALRGLP